MATIKESMEALDAAEACCDALVKAAEDGKLTLLDLRHAVAPAQKLQAGVEGLDKIMSELKDLDEAEAAQVIQKALSVSGKAMNALALVSKAKVSLFMPAPGEV